MAKLVDRRDIDFLLNEVLEVQNLTKLPRFKDHDAETFAAVLDAAEKLATEVLYPTNADGDRTGVKLVDGVVKMPASFKAAYKEFTSGQWSSVCDSYDVGGQQMPHVIGAMGTIMFGAGNHALLMGPGLTHGAAKLVMKYGTDSQKKRYLPKMLSGEWGGTMCLTEPQAGSDVGNLTTTAKRNPDGTFTIKGTKIFISWGDSELYGNVVHPVLARIEGDPAGTKGISIFLVPKTHVNEDGTLGKRNDVAVTGLEHKMGIHASPTCVMAFGENDQCIGELLGKEREGMKIMFNMMNGARLETGIQGIACSEPAYQYALQYTRERMQGSSVKDFKNADAPRISILKHPDVRRMVIDMRSKVEGIRALIGFVALNLDLEAAAEGSEKETASGMVELLMPIAKAWSTDVGFDVNETAIQCLGGHGFLRDHPLEQYMRDMKIASLYEGTNGIQAMDLLGRKLGMKGGAVLMALMAKIGEVVDRVPASLKAEAALVGEMKELMGQTAMNLSMQFMGGDIEGPLLNSKPFLDSMGDTVVAWLLLWEAEVATQKLEALCKSHNVAADKVDAFARTNEKAGFYYTKIRTARYFIQRNLPITRGRFTAIATNDRSPLEAILAEEDAAVAA